MEKFALAVAGYPRGIAAMRTENCTTRTRCSSSTRRGSSTLRYTEASKHHHTTPPLQKAPLGRFFRTLDVATERRRSAIWTWFWERERCCMLGGVFVVFKPINWRKIKRKENSDSPAAKPMSDSQFKSQRMRLRPFRQQGVRMAFSGVSCYIPVTKRLNLKNKKYNKKTTCTDLLGFRLISIL